MDKTLRLALVQMTAARAPQDNLPAALAAVACAAEAGAQLVATPEMTLMLEMDGKAALAKSHPPEAEPAIAAFAAAARRHGLWLLVGSLALKVEARRLANRSLLFAPDGRLAASYDKIHMFDVDLPGGERFRESRTYRPGERAVVASTPWGGLGLTICYDLRFAHLYRDLAQAGAKIISVPAAFTKQTGAAHWHVLLRARAIETGCFVIAPAQTGRHEAGRETYGHSLVVSPWGDVLADGGSDPGLVMASLDLSEVEKARRRIPALSHDRAFTSAASPRKAAS
ncbi:MAG: carbon-nitrogen hydrolase family protein [Alphaproteobacteria bacterium]|nr:MAG: carbon-nitrogen hydrolase family protein [Alphaproteobacteria bacterium]